MTLVTRACDPVMWPNHVTAVMIVLPVMAVCAWVLQRHHRHPQQQQQQAIRNRIFGEKQKAEFPAGPAASPQLSSLFDHERRSFNLKDWLSWDLGEVRAERRTALLRCQGCRLKCLFFVFCFFFTLADRNRTDSEPLRPLRKSVITAIPVLPHCVMDGDGAQRRRCKRGIQRGCKFVSV